MAFSACSHHIALPAHIRQDAPCATFFCGGASFFGESKALRLMYRQARRSSAPIGGIRVLIFRLPSCPPRHWGESIDAGHLLWLIRVQLNRPVTHGLTAFSRRHFGGRRLPASIRG
jgi:hypothetical protein